MSDRLLARFKDIVRYAEHRVYQRPDGGIYISPNNREITKEQFEKLYHDGFLDLDAVPGQPVSRFPVEPTFPENPGFSNPAPPLPAAPQQQSFLPPGAVTFEVPLALDPQAFNSEETPLRGAAARAVKKAAKQGAKQAYRKSGSPIKPLRKKPKWVKALIVVLILGFLTTCCSIPVLLGVNWFKSQSYDKSARSISALMADKKKTADEKRIYGEKVITPESAGLKNDNDKDGLTNAEEIKHKTDFANPDTDGDGLSDGDEIKKYHTDPTKYSSSGDGIADGVKVSLKMDPTRNATKLPAMVEKKLGANIIVAPDANSAVLSGFSAAPSSLETTSYGSSDVMLVNNFSGTIKIRYAPDGLAKSQMPKDVAAPAFKLAVYDPLSSEVASYAVDYNEKTNWAQAVIPANKKIVSGYAFLATEGQIRSMEMQRDMKDILTYSKGDEIFFVMFNTFGIDGYMSHIQIYKITKDFNFNKQNVAETYDIGPVYLLGQELHPKIEVTYGELSELEYGIFNSTLGKIFTQSVGAGVQNLNEADPNNEVFKSEQAKTQFATAIWHLILYWDRFTYTGKDTLFGGGPSSTAPTAEVLPPRWSGTDFRPGKDGWKFSNFGSEYSPGGNCAGFAGTALLHYEDIKWTLVGKATENDYGAVDFNITSNSDIRNGNLRGYSPTDAIWLKWYRDFNSNSKTPAPLTVAGLKKTPSDQDALKFFGYYSNVIGNGSTFYNQSNGEELEAMKIAFKNNHPLLTYMTDGEMAHALVAYGIEENHNGDPNWTIIYLYDCNGPDEICKLSVYTQIYNTRDKGRIGGGIKDYHDYRIYYDSYRMPISLLSFSTVNNNGTQKLVTTIR